MASAWLYTCGHVSTGTTQPEYFHICQSSSTQSFRKEQHASCVLNHFALARYSHSKTFMRVGGYGDDCWVRADEARESCCRSLVII